MHCFDDGVTESCPAVVCSHCGFHFSVVSSSTLHFSIIRCRLGDWILARRETVVNKHNCVRFNYPRTHGSSRVPLPSDTVSDLNSFRGTRKLRICFLQHKSKSTFWDLDIVFHTFVAGSREESSRRFRICNKNDSSFSQKASI